MAKPRRALDRGQGLVAGVEAVAPGVWWTPSRSDPTGGHVVALIAGRLRCDCLAAAYGRVCVHRGAVALLLLGSGRSPGGKPSR